MGKRMNYIEIYEVSLSATHSRAFMDLEAAIKHAQTLLARQIRKGFEESAMDTVYAAYQVFVTKRTIELGDLSEDEPEKDREGD